jgi:hypothetical protein
MSHITLKSEEFLLRAREVIKHMERHREKHVDNYVKPYIKASENSFFRKLFKRPVLTKEQVILNHRNGDMISSIIVNNVISVWCTEQDILNELISMAKVVEFINLSRSDYAILSNWSDDSL